ncbi:MAG: aminomethyl-transferring glycine dehydrogenase subunit GcvPB [Methanobacteriota archaeon]
MCAAAEAVVDSQAAKKFLPAKLARANAPAIPDLPERDVVRHFTNLSQMNYGVDNGIYPLGSCTMKYNPKLCDEMVGLSGATRIHPLQPEETVQGALGMMWELQEMLKVVGGVDAVTLQPAAGAHGEWTGLMIVRAYHRKRGDDRKVVILPESAHGTNPASAAMAGFEVIEIPSKEGCVDIQALKAAVSDKTAAFMLTNPNTLGIFESDVLEIADVLHQAGALLYYDGANLNAIMGKTTPGAMNFDIVHFNLHKTFATPHGGGGPGAGPVGVKARLEPFLPVPVVAKRGEAYHLDYDRPDSIGKVRSAYGNFLVLLRAYTYIKMLGGNGLAQATETAVLNSNYLRARLAPSFGMPYRELRKHEFVLGGEKLKARGVRTLDLAKRLLDKGFHAPTVYFPHLVDEAIMVEPTETETRETLDRFADAMLEILAEDPELLKGAPHNTAIGRVDEVKAAKDMVFSHRDLKK